MTGFLSEKASELRTDSDMDDATMGSPIIESMYDCTCEGSSGDRRTNKGGTTGS